MAPQGLTRESRQTRAFRDPEGAASIMFPERCRLDLAHGRFGMAVDVLRLTHEGLTLGRVVSGGHEIMLEDPDNITLLLPVDGHFGVTPHSLQLSFQAVHGMSPRQNLQLVRLDRARETILAQVDAASVTKAAMDCGFMHLSRFSQVYRRTFGELPSETLARRQSKAAPGYGLPI